MKKTKFLALVLVVSIMMMGAGYAYWSQTLTFDTTVQTGELEVSFITPPSTGSNFPEQTTSKLTVTDYNTMRVEYGNVYPGAESTLSFKIKNTGSITAHVDDFTIINKNTADVGNVILNPFISQLLVKELRVGTNIITLPSGATLNDVLTYLHSLNGGNGISLAKDEEILVNIDMQVNPLATETNVKEDYTYNFDLVAQVYQFNGRPTPTPAPTPAP